MPTNEEIAEVKRRATAALLGIPGVVAVGLGSKEVRGAPTGQLVIKVYVEHKRPAAEVPPDELIPAEIDGVSTDVVVGGRRIPLVDPPGAVPPSDTDGTRYRPLTGGSRIAVEGSAGQGTMGCLLTHTTDANKVYGLTNQHVIAVGDVSPITAGTTKVGQPSGSGSSTDCCNDLFGVYAGGERTEDRDEALVQLSPGAQWLAEILEIGVVRGKHTVTTAEAGTGTYKVRKRGARTRLTGGVISSLSATTHTADNLIIIAPNPAPAAPAGATVFFAYEGDSGSALVNDANEVVGLIDSRDDAGNGYAYPIANVLSRFASVEHLTLDVATATTPGSTQTVPGTAMVALPPEVAPTLVPEAVGRAGPVLAPVGGWLGGNQPDFAGGMARVRDDLDRSRAGRLLISLWLDHQRELVDLINHNRRVTVAWHRGGGAALMQLCLRMSHRPDVALPRTVNGQPLGAVVDQLREVLSRFGSAALRRDLDRARAALPDLAGLTYPQIITAFDLA